MMSIRTATIRWMRMPNVRARDDIQKRTTSWLGRYAHHAGRMKHHLGVLHAEGRGPWGAGGRPGNGGKRCGKRW